MVGGAGVFPWIGIGLPGWLGCGFWGCGRGCLRFRLSRLLRWCFWLSRLIFPRFSLARFVLSGLGVKSLPRWPFRLLRNVQFWILRLLWLLWGRVGVGVMGWFVFGV